MSQKKTIEAKKLDLEAKKLDLEAKKKKNIDTRKK